MDGQKQGFPGTNQPRQKPVGCKPWKSLIYVCGLTQGRARELPTMESWNTPLYKPQSSLHQLIRVLKKQNFISLVFFQNSSYCTHLTTHMLSWIISSRWEWNSFPTFYLQSHFNSLKSIHQPEKSQLVHLKNTQKR